jgi:hypothetical protein
VGSGKSNSSACDVNDHGYPMYKGAPNCPFYKGTGRCDFNDRCKYHHPADVMLPEVVLLQGDEGLFPDWGCCCGTITVGRVLSTQD